MFLLPIRYNHEQKHLRKSNARSAGKALATDGRTDHAGTQAQAPLHAGHCRPGHSDAPDRLQGGSTVPSTTA